jgi:2-methylcitrate dehydratase PrpD
MALTVAPPTTSVTEAVAQFASRGELAQEEILFERATRAFIDTIGVAIAARREECFSILAGTLGQAAGGATVLPTRGRTSAAEAALLNGTAGHALDYDDVADEIKGHPSVVLVCALLALAEARGSSGRDLLEAYAVGFEVACAIARGLPVEPHYRRGWHATATVGILGAVAGAGRLLRLDQSQIQNALGIAASMASGSRQNFGTMTKPLHAGLVARDVVLAAELAAAGFTADPHQLEGALGYFAMYGVNPRVSEVHSALEQPRVLLEHGLNVKKYPCCYGTHRMADAALNLREHGLRAADVRSIAINVEPDGLGAIIHHQPQQGCKANSAASTWSARACWTAPFACRRLPTRWSIATRPRSCCAGSRSRSRQHRRSARLTTNTRLPRSRSRSVTAAACGNAVTFRAAPPPRHSATPKSRPSSATVWRSPRVTGMPTRCSSGFTACAVPSAWCSARRSTP